MMNSTIILYGVFAGLVAILVTVAIEKFGGFIGGVRVGAGLWGLGINWVPEIAGRGWGPRL